MRIVGNILASQYFKCVVRLSIDIQIHILQCRRRVKHCSICHQPYNQQQSNQHIHCPQCQHVTSENHLTFHRSICHDAQTCLCGSSFPLSSLSNHCRFKCLTRILRCRYCGERHRFDGQGDTRVNGFQQDPVDRFNGLSLHESICANKTVSCRFCEEYVMCRFLAEHYLSHHHIPCIDD